jgi:very-short-patch-repair endonuclease
MGYEYNKDLVHNAQELRRNMTREEKHLWYDFLKKLPFTVHRQKNIGDYIVDFYIPSKSTVIEIDGLQHRIPEISEKDLMRQHYLESLGLKVLRFNNSDINNRFKDVCASITNKLDVSLSKAKQ